MDWREHIEQHPEVMYGKPVLKGTRIPVDLIIEKLSLGETMDDLLAAYPTLDRERILACLAYATALIRNEEAYLLPLDIKVRN